MEEYTLLEFPKREVQIMPTSFQGTIGKSCGYTKSCPREWTDSEIDWMLKMKDDGFTIAEIAESIGRTETSVSIKFKRIGKKVERYNEKHRKEKYAANMEFFNAYKPKTILDAFCGTERWWLKNCPECLVVSNDADKSIPATYNLTADKLVARLYAEDKTFDLIDLDPFGSAYDCFDLAIRMARKSIIVTFGEMGHKRWKRLDFVRYHYGITQLSDFTTQRLVDEFVRIGRMNKKELVPVIVKEWPRISRVYFEIRPMKITEQWAE